MRDDEVVDKLQKQIGEEKIFLESQGDEADAPEEKGKENFIEEAYNFAYHEFKKKYLDDGP